MDFWQRLDETLRIRNLTRKDVTRALGLAPNSFSTWTTRKTVPSAEVVVAIASLLGVSVEFLVAGSPPTSSEVYSSTVLSLASKLALLSSSHLRAVELLVDQLLTIDAPESSR